jgi:Hydantoinase B/oxoprolinase
MQRRFDPVLVEVIKNEIAAVTEEMMLTVYRTGRSGMCKVGDFATAVCDRQGRIVGEGGSPYQMCVFIDTMNSIFKAYDGALRPGDIIIANDPYAGISHMPDITLIAPVFSQEQLIGFVISYSHHTDIGGRFAGGISSVCSESFEEGVRIPPLKLYDRGKRNEVVLEAIAANVRTPEEWIGDVDAKFASCRRGAEQLNKLVGKYGLRQFESTCDYLVDLCLSGCFSIRHMLWSAWARRRRKILCTTYELIWRGFMLGPETEQSLKRRHRLLAPIVAKDEFIEVRLKLSRAHAVMGSDQPLLQVADCAIGQGYYGFGTFT